MKRGIAFLISIILIFGFSVTAFSFDEFSTETEITEGGIIVDFAPQWSNLSHISYSCYTYDGAFVFAFTASSKASITVKAQIYRDGFFDTKVGDEYVFSAENKFLQGEILEPISKNDQYYIKVTVISADDTVTKKVIPVGALKGDADGNGKITAADARIILRTSAKLQKMSDYLIALCDMNGDGNVTASDARTVLRKAAKLN